MSFSITRKYLTNNDCYKSGRTIVPKGIMVHSTGADNPSLKRYIQPDDGILGKNNNNNDWNRSGIAKCVHAFIGKDNSGVVRCYQTLPWNYRGWHGGGSSNDSYVGFEICEDGLNDRDYFNEIYEQTVELCVHLCKTYNLTEKNIICHSEGFKMGIASNHGDVMHWFPKHGKSMDTLRSDVKNRLSGKVDPPKQETVIVDNKIINQPAPTKPTEQPNPIEQPKTESPKKGESKLYNPESPTIKKDTEDVIKLLMQGDKGINKSWLDKLQNGTLTESQATGLLFTAIKRGLLK